MDVNIYLCGVEVNKQYIIGKLPKAASAGKRSLGHDSDRRS